MSVCTHVTSCFNIDKQIPMRKPLPIGLVTDECSAPAYYHFSTPKTLSEFWAIGERPGSKAFEARLKKHTCCHFMHTSKEIASLRRSYHLNLHSIVPDQIPSTRFNRATPDYHPLRRPQIMADTKRNRYAFSLAILTRPQRSLAVFAIHIISYPNKQSHLTPSRRTAYQNKRDPARRRRATYASASLT